ncbi:MAG: malectin domain-containing carbohydrate-binding protein, partial [bacterium]
MVKESGVFGAVESLYTALYRLPERLTYGPLVMQRGLYLFLFFLAGVGANAAPEGLPSVDFQYANTNVQTLIGIKDGWRNPVVLSDGTLLINGQPLEIELLSINGRVPRMETEWRQDLVDGYLPIVQTRARYGGLQIHKTAFTAQSDFGPYDVLQVDILNPRSTPQEARISVRFGSAAVRRVNGGLILDASQSGIAYLSEEWAVGVSDLGAQTRDAVLGYVGVHNVLQNWTAAPDGLNPAFRHAAVGWYGRPIHYRFPARTDQTYTVVLGLCEGYWDQPGRRLLDIQVEGDQPVILDPVEISGKNKPMTLQFLGEDRSGDGWIDIICAPNEKSPDNEAILSTIWVFEGQPAVDELGTDLITGKGGWSALYQQACGEQNAQRASGPDGIVQISLPPAGRGSFVLLLPWEDRGETGLSRTDPRGLFDQTQAGWRTFLDESVDISVPDRMVIDFYRACLIQLFLHRGCTSNNSPLSVESTVSGGMSIRDQTLISAALSMSGYHWAARECLEALIARQKSDGEWACPPERWDGAGQAIWAFWLEGLLSGNNQFLRSGYPAISRACEWIDRRRQAEADQIPRRNDPTYGLLPPCMASMTTSIEHNYGYNFWSLYGLRLAADIAERIGETSDARRWQVRYRQYRNDLSRSIGKSFSRTRGILPASPEEPGDRGVFSYSSNACAYPLS